MAMAAVGLTAVIGAGVLAQQGLLKQENVPLPAFLATPTGRGFDPTTP